MPEEATGKTGVPSETRKKPERPRDLLGRPLAWDAVNELELEDYDSHVDRGEPRPRPGVHAGATVLPGATRRGRRPGSKPAARATRSSSRASRRWAPGYTHLRRGNAHGTIMLLRRAAGRIGAYPDPHRGIATTALNDRLLADASRVDGRRARARRRGDVRAARRVACGPRP